MISNTHYTNILKKKYAITYFGDSFMSYSINSIKYSWVDNSTKYLKKKYKENINFYKNISVGITSRGILDKLPNFFSKIKKKDILIYQFGANDSWHYISLKGSANVSLNSFKKNLAEILKKSKNYGFKKIIFVGYHGVSKNRIEGNFKTINQNLSKYNQLLKSFCKKNKLIYADVNIENKKVYNLKDGIHLNKNGAKLYSNKINKILLKIINEKKI